MVAYRSFHLIILYRNCFSVEHVVYVINQAYNVYQESLTCQYNVTNPLKLYGTLTFGSVYQSVPYHHLLTMYLLVSIS